MFKKKPIYIVGIIIFSLILVADLAIYFLAPTGGNRGNMPSMDGGAFGFEEFEGEMPEGFDAENFSPEDFAGQMPNGGDFSGEMPEGFDAENFSPEDFAGQMPNGGDFSGEMPEGFDGENFNPEDFAGQMPGGAAGGGIMGTIRGLFWPVLIVCILGDAVCIFMLIRISKKKDNLTENEQVGDDDDNPPRRDRSNTFLAIIALFLVGAVTITSLSSGETSSGREAEKSVLQQEASVSDITSTFAGSGTLQSSEATNMEIPVAVNVTSYTVQNGDYVEAGDVIAKVDKNSVLNAIYEVQTLIDEIDAEIAEVQGNTLDSEITARADGRVKAIYVEEGSSISGAMYQNGALILISLGGSMTTEIESEASVSVGETLTVTLSDESQIEGKVQQVRNGKITVTTTDDGPTPGESVTVATVDGTTLGTGTLEVSSPLKVTGFAGTVENLHVEVGDEVEVGDTLLTLSDTEDHARYSQLLRERDELTALESDLAQMYQDGTIKAEQSGIVSQLSDEIGYTELSAESDASYTATNLAVSYGNGYGNVQFLSASAAQPRVMLLAAQTSPDTEGTPPSEEGATPGPESSSPPAENVPSGEESTTPPPTEGTTPGGEDASTPPADGTTPPEVGTLPPDGGTTPPTQTQADGTYAGKVSKVSYGGLQIKISETDMTGATIASLETMDEALFTVEKQYTPDVNVPVYVYQNGQSIQSSVSAIQAGDKVLIRIENGAVAQIDYIVGAGEETPSVPGGTTPGGTTPGGTTEGGFTDGGMQMPSTGGSYGYQQPIAEEEEEEEATYVVEKSSLCAITPSETMMIEVPVDELDILNLAVGQTVTVTLDALPGQSVTGSVKKISPIGTTEDGGSTKYTVTIEVPRTDEMLDGMNASIRIEVSCLEGVLTVPAAAINEDGTRTFVYTGIDEKTGEPIHPVDVETGASDGTNIEILSGLSEGDVVYYSYADSITYRFES